MLSESDTAKDYEAVMESADRLRAGAPNGWPRPGFTLEENRADLVRHEREFIEGVAFAYTMVDPDDRSVLGCVYFNPSEVADVDVHMWVRDRHAEALTGPLYRAVARWLENEWPFETINYIRPDYYLPYADPSGGKSLEARP
jgi:hypothetical protein